MINLLLRPCVCDNHLGVMTDTNTQWRTASGTWFGETSRKARLNRLSNSTLEVHQTTYQKPYAIRDRSSHNLGC